MVQKVAYYENPSHDGFYIKGTVSVFEFSEKNDVINHRWMLRYLAVEPHELEIIIKVIVDFKSQGVARYVKDLFDFYFVYLNPAHKGHIETLESVSNDLVHPADANGLATIFHYFATLNRSVGGYYNVVSLKKPTVNDVFFIKELVDRTITFREFYDARQLVITEGEMRQYSNYESNLYHTVVSGKYHDSHKVEAIRNVYDLAHDKIEYQLGAYVNNVQHFIVFNPMLNKAFVWAFPR